jgi:serine/threonine-protein kinase
MIGKQILHYRVEKLLNKSSMSTIYLATDTLSGTLVASKVYNAYIVKSTRLSRHLKNAMPLLTKLAHPNIMQVHEVTEQPEGICMITEYVEGISLAQYISRATRELPEEEIIHIFLQILKAIAFAHKREVLHTDIKPSNILITKDKQVKVSFCSTARLLTPDAPILARTGLKIGNIHYKSPEQIYEKPVDIQSDVYSAGVVLYELLTGYGPYATSNCSEFEIQNKIVYEPLFKADQRRQGMRGKLQLLVNKATAKNPEDRFADIDDFITAIQELQPQPTEKQYHEVMHEVPVGNIQATFTDDSSVIAQRKQRIKNMAGIFAVFILMSLCFFIITLTYRYAPRVANKQLILERTADKNELEPVTDTEPDSVVINDSSVNISNPVVQAAITTVSSASPAIATEAELQYRLESYYQAMQTKDAAQLSEYFAPTLIRFFNEYGVSDELLLLLLNQSWERTPEAKYNIQWETFRYSRDENGNYVVDYYMNYKYRRANRRSWGTQKVYTMIKMDKDLKIYYITGD